VLFIHLLVVDPTTDWTNYVQTGGTIGVLTAAIIGILRQWIVPGWTYQAMVRDRDYYREIANQSILLADRQTTVAETLTEHLTRSDQRHLTDRADRARQREEDGRR
jgi:hypothetical protein